MLISNHVQLSAIYKLLDHKETRKLRKNIPVVWVDETEIVLT